MAGIPPHIGRYIKVVVVGLSQGPLTIPLQPRRQLGPTQAGDIVVMEAKALLLGWVYVRGVLD